MRGLYLIFFLIILELNSKPLWASDERSLAQAFHALTVYTENYPPLNYEENGEAKGLSVDVLHEIYARLKIPFEPTTVVVVPWARGYVEAQSRKHSMLFSTIRTPSREALFHWVGPIGASHTVLMANRRDHIVLDTPPEFNKYSYGVVQHDRGEQALFEVGVTRNKMVHMNSPLSAAHLLARGRVDVWAYERIVSYWVLQNLGYKVQDFEVVHAFDASHYYFAFNLESDARVMAAMQSTLDDIRADGTLATIVEGYIPGASDEFLAINFPENSPN